MPLLKHGCAELASAQYTIPPERVFHLLVDSLDVAQVKYIGRLARDDQFGG